MIDSAKYGRMEIGRCITQSFGYIGCNVDVLDIMDSFCSGKQRCSVGANQRALLDRKQTVCPKDFVAYLLAAYKCIKGEVILIFDYNEMREDLTFNDFNTFYCS